MRMFVKTNEAVVMLVKRHTKLKKSLVSPFIVLLTEVEFRELTVKVVTEAGECKKVEIL